MKKLVLIMATIVGLIPGLAPGTFTNLAYASNHESQAEEQYPQLVPPSVIRKNTRQQVLEINFTVRTFLWALDRKKPKILAKIAAPQMLADFPNANMMMATMARVHKPVIGAKNVFLHLPTIKKNTAVQVVYLQDIKGNSWKATYMLKRSNTGRYGVFGCVLKKLPGKFS